LVEEERFEFRVKLMRREGKKRRISKSDERLTRGRLAKVFR